MKKRFGFVSNSSSSSFIVICDDESTLDFSVLNHHKEVGELRIGEYGESEFGWEFEKWDDFDSKLNWTVLQIKRSFDLKKQIELLGMLHEVLGEHFGGEIFDELSGYIDHQSCAHENPANGEMLESKEKLRNFLFNKKSFIQGGNDNV